MASYYARFARNGLGLIVTEATFIDSESSKAYYGQPGMHCIAHERSWARVVEAVHRERGRIVLQLQHGGPLAEPGLNSPVGATDRPAGGVSWQRKLPYGPVRPLHSDELPRIRSSFANAAARAMAAGFDGVEIHGARGYLLDAFLSATNTREDRYGHGLAGRLLFPIEVVAAVREAIGDAPLIYNLSLYKMDDSTYLPPGGADEVATIVQALGHAGVDAIHATTRDMFAPALDGEPFVKLVKRSASCLVIGNGGLGGIEGAERVLGEGHCDLVSMARTLVANPDLIRRHQEKMPLRAFVRGMERELVQNEQAE